MTFLLIADLHFSDREKDRHRFGLLPWLAKQQRKHKVTATFILGDLCENKDRHSASLVNAIVDGITQLETPIYILMGNHDRIDIKTPFFRFVNNISGINFITEAVYLDALHVALIPHCVNQDAFDKACDIIPQNAKAVFLHNTFTSAISEATGSQLTGLSPAPITAKNPHWVYSGDIHKPQRVGPVTYVGAPYSVRFGDDYDPRVVLLDDKGEHNLYYECPRKWALHIRDADDLKSDQRLLSKDQVRITLELTKEEVVEWQQHKAKVIDVCKQLELEVFGVELKVLASAKSERKVSSSPGKSAGEVLQAFCLNEGVASNIKEAGISLLK